MLRPLLLAAALAAPLPAAADGTIRFDWQARTAEEAALFDLGLTLYGLRHGADVRQRGAGNGAGVSQSGAGNRALIRQRGRGHAADVRQSGGGNAQAVFQFGRGTDSRVVQRGGQSGLSLLFGF
ncbi:hypothetical protein [Wenxinia marina]|uniref:Curlin associated repeat protein n=1 Tax=Wenxinia marina DSM 24838 TaxID=1123501 RepID=A0A0D0PCU2_9RHOB|nr:hypothetical protein [Wenxinia marina]KIQ69206.1 hypothetical protein Wenmar_02277 [Wenxinia marina DSM 24838]GGL71154.1 hypothetical protein GCM10011392_27150 [Wenxinia marina]